MFFDQYSGGLDTFIYLYSLLELYKMIVNEWTCEVKENGNGDNSNIEILTDIGDEESRICCKLGSLGSRPHNEGKCAECL